MRGRHDMAFSLWCLCSIVAVLARDVMHVPIRGGIQVSLHGCQRLCPYMHHVILHTCPYASIQCSMFVHMSMRLSMHLHMDDPPHSLHWLLCLPCWHKAEPPQSLHWRFCRPCRHMDEPPQSLHRLLRRPCGHICEPPQSLHRLFCRPCSHFGRFRAGAGLFPSAAWRTTAC